MNSSEIVYRPVGIIHSEIAASMRIPAMPAFQARQLRGIAEIYPEYVCMLQGVEDFSHLYVIYHEIRSGNGRTEDCSFSASASHQENSLLRLNPIGLSLVELILWQGNLLHLRGVDIQNGSPIIDIRSGEPRHRQTWPARGSWLGQADEFAVEPSCKYGFPA